jgi:glycosyltransferase involved in cell wall biosynthesis
VRQALSYPLQLQTLFPHYNTGGANSHIAVSICGGLREHGAIVNLFLPASDAHARRAFTRDYVPGFCKSLVYKLPQAVPRVLAFSERRFARAVQAGDLAYLWPGVTLDLYRRLRDRGVTIAVERINCHTAFSKRILDAEYAALGWPLDHGVTDKLIHEERAELSMADLIFSPSPEVDRTLVEEGVPQTKIIPSSYGWDPQRLAPARAAGLARTPSQQFTVLFLGYACVRKGIHLLLEAWRRANIEGRLLIAGRVATDVATNLQGPLVERRVTLLGHVADVASLFQDADVMALPTLEEGGPLVTYEAMAAGLVPLVSPMGAGRVARNTIDSVVLPPHDLDGWVNALQRLAHDFAWRRQLAENAVSRANEFTWSECARVRFAGLQQKLAELSGIQVVGTQA